MTVTRHSDVSHSHITVTCECETSHLRITPGCYEKYFVGGVSRVFLMSSENREMLEDELAQDFFPDLDVTAIEKVTLVHDAGDDVWIAGHGGATGRDAEKAGAIEALAVALRERE